MTVTDQIKILNRKIKQNEAQYNLDRKAAKISARSSNNLDRYEYLTGEVLSLKPSTIEQAKFEYSPLGKMFNKGMSEDDKKEGLLKRLENILLNTFSTTNKTPKNKTNNQSKKLVYNTEHSFSKLKNISDIKKLSLDSMFNLTRKYHKKFIGLKNLVPRTENNKKLKQEVLINAGDIYNALYDIYKNKYNKKINSLSTKNRKNLDYEKLRLSDDYLYSSEEKQEEQKEIFPIKSDGKTEQQTSKKPTKDDVIALNKWIIDEETDINEELFKKYFLFQTPCALLKDLYKTNDKEKNSELVNLINSGLKALKEEIV